MRIVSPSAGATSSGKKRKGTPKVNFRALLAAGRNDEGEGEDDRCGDNVDGALKLAVGFDPREEDVEDAYGEESFCSDSERESVMAHEQNHLRSSYHREPADTTAQAIHSSSAKESDGYSFKFEDAPTGSNKSAESESYSAKFEEPDPTQLAQTAQSSPPSSKSALPGEALPSLSVKTATSDSDVAGEEGEYTIEVAANIELLSPGKQPFRQDFLELARGDAYGHMTVSGNILADSPPIGAGGHSEADNISLLSRGDPRRPLSSRSREERGETKPGIEVLTQGKKKSSLKWSTQDDDDEDYHAEVDENTPGGVRRRRKLKSVVF